MDVSMANRLDRGFFKYQEEFEKKAVEVLRSGWYVLGKEVSSFEEEFAEYIGTKYCAGVGNGLDALILAFRALGIGKGDEVIVQANTYIASVMGITINGATPVFVEPDEYYNLDADKIEEKITDRTKAVLQPVKPVPENPKYRRRFPSSYLSIHILPFQLPFHLCIVITL